MAPVKYFSPVSLEQMAKMLLSIRSVEKNSPFFLNHYIKVANNVLLETFNKPRPR